MINEYTFYYRNERYPFKDKPDEIFSINNHKASREVYIKLRYKVVCNGEYELLTTQDIFWKNHKTDSYMQSKLSTFSKKGNNE